MKNIPINDIAISNLTTIAQVENKSRPESPNHPRKGYHHHDCYQLIIVKKGNAEIMINSRLLRAERGSILMLGCELPHGISKLSEDISVTIIHIPSGVLSWCTDYAELGRETLFLKESQYGYHFKSESLYNRALLLSKRLKQSKGFQRVIDLFSLLDLLCKEQSAEKLITDLPLRTPLTHTSHLSSIERAYSYIYHHFQENIRLHDIAKHAHQNPAALCRAFKKRSGQSIFQFIHQLRIQKACELLRNSEQTVSEIAFEVGYNSFSHFSNQFQRIIHLSPTQYRVKIKLSNL